MEDYFPYLDSDKGNVDIFVHFMEKPSESCVVRNQDLDKFGIFYAHKDVYHFADQLKLPPCNLYTLWFKSSVGGKILPLKDDVGVLKMYSKNQNQRYIHLYACRNNDEFWRKPLAIGEKLIEPISVAVEPVNESVSVNETIGEVMNDVLNEGIHVSFNKDLSGKNNAENGREYANEQVHANAHEEVTHENVKGQDEVFVNDEDETFNGPRNVNGSSGNEYDHFNDEDCGSEIHDNDFLSDFEEIIHIVGNHHHSNYEIIEIYKENGIFGKSHEIPQNGRIHLEVGQLFMDLNHFRQVPKDFSIQEGFQLKRIKNVPSRVKFTRFSYAFVTFIWHFN